MSIGKYRKFINDKYQQKIKVLENQANSLLTIK